jgi:F0F1-type ATP synthase membrane subunit c/vacuolar-type H+-ATPase subunit K
VLISYVALKHGLRAAAVACLLAAIGAGLGGAAMYGWSARDPAAALKAVSAVPAVSTSMIVRASAAMDREGWFAAALKGPVNSTPYKVYALLAPSKGVGLPGFAFSALPVRLPRFLLVALGFSILRYFLRERIDARWLMTGFTAGWLLFYVWFWATHPG